MTAVTRTRAWDIAAQVAHPGLPAATIADLGVLRDVTEDDQGRVHVQITPLAAGSPAAEDVRAELVEVLSCAGYRHVDVELVRAPAWTTDWLTQHGRRVLAARGLLAHRGA